MISATQSNHPLASVGKAHASIVDAACARLRQARMRITKPRVAILEALSRQSVPVAIEYLHAELNSRKCDLVTVYRCLAAFEEQGIVRRSFLHSGTCLYQLSLETQPSNYHVVCRQCQRIDPVDYFPVDAADRSLRERGYTQLSHVVEFFGICPACQGDNIRSRNILAGPIRR